MWGGSAIGNESGATGNESRAMGKEGRAKGEGREKRYWRFGGAAGR